MTHDLAGTAAEREALDKLDKLAELLKWFEPMLRSSPSSDWHIVSGAKLVAWDHHRRISRLLAEHERDQARDLDDDLEAEPLPF